MSNVYDELKENGIDVFLANHTILDKSPLWIKSAEDLRLYLYDYPEGEQDLYLSYYLDELPDLIEAPELLWRLIVFERSIYEDDNDKDSWRVPFQDYIKCFPWTEDLMNADEKPDLSEWQEKSRIRKAQRPKRKPVK